MQWRQGARSGPVRPASRRAVTAKPDHPGGWYRGRLAMSSEPSNVVHRPDAELNHIESRGWEHESLLCSVLRASVEGPRAPCDRGNHGTLPGLPRGAPARRSGVLPLPRYRAHHEWCAVSRNPSKQPQVHRLARHSCAEPERQATPAVPRGAARRRGARLLRGRPQRLPVSPTQPSLPD